jgi:hypothetical protein
MPVEIVKGAADAVPMFIAMITAAKEPITGCNVAVFMGYPFALDDDLDCSAAPGDQLAGKAITNVHTRMFEIYRLRIIQSGHFAPVRGEV